MSYVQRFVAATGLDRPRIAYAMVFTAALLSRLATVQRGVFTPWWDGIGWGYADLWIGGAVGLAFEGSTRGLHFTTEGLTYVPVLALFLKIFGLSSGLEAWSFVLIAVSALVALFAVMTVHLITGRLLGGVVAGALVIFDPVLEWFGLNGWSDSFTFLGVAASFLLFFAAARRPTLPRLALLGVSLAFLALGHATWTWPALAWAILAWPLLANRRWFARTTPPRDRPYGRLRFAIPLLAFLVSMMAVNWFLVGAGIAESGNYVPVFSSDVNNQRSLVSWIEPDVEWDTWEPSDTIRTFVFTIPGLIPTLFSDLAGQQLTGAIPFSALLLLILAIGVCGLALARGSPRLSGWALFGPAVFAVLAVALDPVDNAAVVILMLVLGVAWIYLPAVRTILLLIGPLTIILTVFFPVITHFRHSNAVLYALVLIAGVVVDSGLRSAPERRAWLVGRFSTLAVAAGLLILVGIGVFQAVTAMQFRLAEERYLGWLGGIMESGDVLLTTGDVNPWRVHEIVGNPVAFDIEHGGRLLITDSTSRWDQKVPAVAELPATTEEILAALAGDGRLWFYRPHDRAAEPLFVPRLGSDDGHASFYSLVPVAPYPEDNFRAAMGVGVPVVTPLEPASLPSQTGRG